jgi:phosphoribosylanthranilate isomerase
MVKVKICGITNIEDALAAIEFGTDALGFVFYKGSPRYLDPEQAKGIIEKLPPFVNRVGVFVDESIKEMERISDYCGFDIIQLHGDEPPEVCLNLSRRVIKAFRIRDWDSLEPLSKYSETLNQACPGDKARVQSRVSAYLLDAYTPDKLGGTGEIFNWDIALAAKRFGRIILSGGLTPDNVEMAVRYIMPYGVDVSTGVEMERNKRKKDHVKMRLFIETAKGLWQEEPRGKREV